MTTDTRVASRQLHAYNALGRERKSSRDFFGPRISGQELAVIPHSRVALIPRRRHFVFADAPEELRSALISLNL